jgi:hypothetical protein
MSYILEGSVLKLEGVLAKEDYGLILVLNNYIKQKVGVEAMMWEMILAGIGCTTQRITCLSTCPWLEDLLSKQPSNSEFS